MKDLDSVFPFQLFISLVKDDQCPMQKKLKQPDDLNKLKGVKKTLENKVQIEQYLEKLETALKEKLHSNQKRKLLNIQKQVTEVLYFGCKFQRYYLLSDKEKERRYSHLKELNKNIFFKKRLKDPLCRKYRKKPPKRFQKNANIFFFPNKLREVIKLGNNNGYKYAYTDRNKSSSNQETVETLQFLYADIDQRRTFKLSLEKIIAKLPEWFPKPDVMVETSPGSYHLYWSLKHEILSEKETKNGKQSDERLIKWKVISNYIQKTLGGDNRHPASQMRVPGMWSYKKGIRPRFMVKYTENSRTLSDALRSPTFELNKIWELLDVKKHTYLVHEFNKVKRKYEDGDFTQEVEIISDSIFELKNNKEKKVLGLEYFKKGAENFLQNIEQFLENFYSENQSLQFITKARLGSLKLSNYEKKLLLYIWEHRFHKNDELIFWDDFTNSLKGSSRGHTRLQETLTNINFRFAKVLNTDLITLKTKHTRTRKNIYELNKNIFKLAGSDTSKNQLPALRYDNYTKGKRNWGICRDVRDMLAAGYSPSEIQKRCELKVKNGSQLGTNACENQTREIKAWISYFTRKNKLK